MKLRILAAIAILAAASLGRAEEGTESSMDCRAHGHSAALVPEGKPASGRQYAPDRLVDVEHITIDVTPDYAKRSIGGTTTLKFRVIAAPLKTLSLDAVDLTVSKVESSAAIEGWTNTGEAVVITFKDALAAESEATITVSHNATPHQGIYFRTPEMGYKPEDTHLWSQGETHEARHWFPGYDYPNERATSEMICHVPKDMIVLSNGRLAEERDEPATGLKVFRWLQEKPHANYLIALAAGKFKKIEADYKGLPIAFYTPASQIAYAKDSFKDTADMIAFFEGETGTPYQWAKYFQVVVDDFTWGGMENTSLTILTDRTLHPTESEPIRSSVSLVAHELAHQWFGDYVTCKDWSQVWLNEGFATYYALLYAEHKYGRDQMVYELMKDAQKIFEFPASGSVVDRTYADPQERFNAMPYDKGSWVLHMLRSRLGPELYRKVIKTYLESNGLRAVVTEDLNKVVEELSGKSFDPFFDQWALHAGFPKLDVSYSWDEAHKLAKVSVKQTQEIKDGVSLFDFTATMRFKSEGSVKDHEIQVREKEQDFYIPLPAQPKTVRFDPDYTILAKVEFNPPRDMLFAQLADASDAAGRLIALDTLEKQSDAPVVEKIAAALRGDSFWAVRVEAAGSLKKIHTPEALTALLDAGDQPDARVRQAIARALGGFYEERAKARLLEIAKHEKSDDIAASAVEPLGKHGDKDSRAAVIDALKSRSWRNVRAEAAITAIRAADDPDYIPALKATLDSDKGGFSSFGFARGLEALGYLGRTLDDPGEVRKFLLNYIESPRRTIQAGAIRGLGELRDTKAIAAIQPFTNGPGDDPIRKAAEGAVKTLQEAKKVPVELGDLRGEVTELKKKNDELRRDLDDVKKRLDAQKAAN